MECALFELHAHRLAVPPRHDDAGSLAFSRADHSKDPCRGPPLALWLRGAGASPCPAPGEFGLLADLRFVMPPQLYRRSRREPAFGLRQKRRIFLELAMLSDLCPWWRGRADGLQ